MGRKREREQEEQRRRWYRKRKINDGSKKLNTIKQGRRWRKKEKNIKEEK